MRFRNLLISNQRSQAWGLAILRIVVGLVFVAHGLQKLFVFGPAGMAGFMAKAGFPLPGVSAALVTAAELGGGLLLVLGLATRLAALPLAFSMLVALGAVHLRGGFFLPAGFEYVLTLLAATVGLALAGPGALAVDNWLLAPRKTVQRARPQAVPVARSA